MKICLVYNKENMKYDELTKNIVAFFENKNKELQSNIITSDIKKGDVKICKKKYDIYVFLSDSIAELKGYYEKIGYPTRTALITENTTVEFISESTNIVKDIIYSRSEMDSICSRLICAYSKYITEDMMASV